MNSKRLHFTGIILLHILVSINLTGYSQQKKDTPKLTPPKMSAFWGFTKGGILTVNDIIQLTDSSIFVITDKKERLKISRAIFLYRSKDMVEDEETGTYKTKYNSISYDFRNTDRLPEQWSKHIKENIKSGDQLIIADILVRNKYEELFKAGDIRISVQ